MISVVIICEPCIVHFMHHDDHLLIGFWNGLFQATLRQA